MLIDSRPGCLPATRCCGDVHHRPIARCCLLLALASCLRSSGDFAHLTVDSSHLHHVSPNADLTTVPHAPMAATSPLAHSTSRLTLGMAARSTSQSAGPTQCSFGYSGQPVSPDGILVLRRLRSWCLCLYSHASLLPRRSARCPFCFLSSVPSASFGRWVVLCCVLCFDRQTLPWLVFHTGACALRFVLASREFCWSLLKLTYASHPT